MISARRWNGLRARLDVTATAGVLREKIDRLNKSIEKLRKQGAGQVADAQSAGFARMFQVERDVAQTGLSVLLALVIESVCCFGLLVIAGAHPDAMIGAGPSLPEWIGEWLTERAEPHPGTRVSFRELETDFRRWVDGRPAPKLSFAKVRKPDPRRMRRGGAHSRGGYRSGLAADFIAADASGSLVGTWVVNSKERSVIPLFEG